MNKKLLSVALLSLSFSSFAALAEQDCSKMDSTGGVYDCVQKNKDESEVALNKAYGEAKKKITAAYSNDASYEKPLQLALLDGQRAWVKFRENQCKMESLVAEEGSSANKTAANNCIIRMNKQRIAQFGEIPY